jgi:hypothetical protein
MRLQGATSQKAVIFNSVTASTWNLTKWENIKRRKKKWHKWLILVIYEQLWCTENYLYDRAENQRCLTTDQTLQHTRHGVLLITRSRNLEDVIPTIFKIMYSRHRRCFMSLSNKFQFLISHMWYLSSAQNNGPSCWVSRISILFPWLNMGASYPESIWRIRFFTIITGSLFVYTVSVTKCTSCLHSLIQSLYNNLHTV